jgi:hypothetical protein
MDNLVQVLSPLQVTGGLSLGKTLLDFPLNPRHNQIEVILGVPYIYTMVDGMNSWFPLTQKKRSYVHLQGVESLTWTINHNLNSTDIMYFAYDETGILQDVQGEALNTSTLRLTLSQAKKGKVIIFASDFLTAPSITSDLISSDKMNVGNGALVVDETGVYASGVNIVDQFNVIAANLTAEQLRATGVEGILATLTTSTKANLVAAINEIKAIADTVNSRIDSKVLVETNRAKAVEGTLVNLNASLLPATNLVEAINNAASLTGNETVRAKAVEGILSNLTTTDKANLVAAINEVIIKDGIETARVNTLTGILVNLTSADKTNLVAAINSVQLAVSNANLTTGSLSSLDTVNKGTVVAAINELHTDLGAMFTKEGSDITFYGNLIPSENDSFSIGSPTHVIQDMHISANTIYLGETTQVSGTGISIDAGLNPTQVSEQPTFIASRLVARPFTYNGGTGAVTVRPSIEFQDEAGLSNPISFNSATGEFSLDRLGNYGEGSLRGKTGTFTNVGGKALDLTGNVEVDGKVFVKDEFRADGNVFLGYDATDIVSIRGTLDIATPISFTTGASLGDGNDNIVINSGLANLFTVNSKEFSIDQLGNTNLRDLTVRGNITVLGTTTTVNSETITFADNMLELNSNFITGDPTENAGLNVRRGDKGLLSILTWNETNNYVAIPVLNGELISQEEVATKNFLAAQLVPVSNYITNIKNSVNLLADGTFRAVTGTNYMNSATDLVNMAELLDVQVKENATTSASLLATKFDKTGGLISGNLQTTGTITENGTALATKYLGKTATAVAATKLATARTIGLTGDVSGILTFDGTSNETMETTVADNSHNHTSLVGLTSLAFTTEGSDSASITTFISGTNTYFDFNLTDDVSQDDAWRWRFTPSAGIVFDAMKLDAVTATRADLTVSGKVIADGFIGGVDKLSTARTISLSGGVTGVMTFDGSVNKTILATVTDNSHKHLIDNVTGLQVELDNRSLINHAHDYLPSTAQALDSALLNGRSGADYVQADNLNGYEGLMVNGNASNWIRSSVQGFLPHAAGGTSALGTTSWPFNAIHGVTFYEGGTTLAAKYLGKADNAASATKLATVRTISLTGDVTGSISFDGSANAVFNAVVTDDSHSHSNYLPLTGGVVSGGITAGSLNSSIINTGNGQQLILNAGESEGKVANQTAEYVYANAEQGLMVSTPDSSHGNWEAGYSVQNTVITGRGITVDGSSVFHTANLGKAQVDAWDVNAGTLDGLDSTAFVKVADLSSSILTNSTVTGANSTAVKTAYDKGVEALNMANTKLTSTDKAVDSDLLDGLDSSAFVKTSALTNSVTSTSSTLAATAAAVKLAYDRGTAGIDRANAVKSELLGGAPAAALDTLNELAIALTANDSDIAAITTSIAGKLGSTENAVSASKLVTARNIALTGDVTGSVNFDGSGNVSIVAVVGDDSHNHTVANVDGLQTALNGKLDNGANAVSATKLATTRTINGVSFDGTSNITVEDSTKLALSGGNLTGNLNVASTKGLSTGRVHHSVGGGFYETTTSVTTGAINVILPQSWTSTMMKFYIDVYEYNSGKTFSVLVGGYNYGTGSWVNTSATVVGGDTGVQYNIRFGHNGTKCTVSIGESASSWSYVQVSIRDFHHGYSDSNVNSWDDGWDITVGTLPSTISSTVSPSLYATSAAVATKLETARTIALTGDVTGSITFDGSGNVSIVTAVGNDSHSHDSQYYTKGISDGRYLYAGSNAVSATKLATTRNIALTGGVTGSVNFDGTGNVVIAAVVANDSHTHDGRYYTEAESDSRYLGISSKAADANLLDGLDLTSASTVSTVVARDSAGDINARLFRSEYDVTNGSVNFIMTQIDTTGNNYIRPTTPAQFRAGVTDAYYLGAGSNAVSATRLATARNIALTGDVTGSVNFDGSGNVSIGAVVGDDSHSHSAGTLNGVALSQGRVVTDCNSASFRVPGMYGFNGSPANGPGEAYGAMIVAANSDTGLQIAGGYSNDDLYFRGWASSGATYYAWRQIVHSGNVSAMISPATIGAAPASHSHDYLASGGTATNADRVDGYHASESAGAASTVVARNSNGYIMNTWFNSNRGDEASAAASYIYDTGDGYMRKKSLANVQNDIVTQAKVNSLSVTAYNSGLLDGIDSSQFIRSDADASFSSRLLSTSRRGGIYGTYDSTKTDHIWSMGSAYMIEPNGANFGGLYGLAYKHTNNGSGGTMAGGHMMVWCQNGGGTSAMGDNIWTSGNVIAYSDARVKENLEVIPDALNKVLQLNGYTYDRTDVVVEGTRHNLTGRHVGVIAQEVLKVLPEAVSGGPTELDEEAHYSVAYGNLAALFIEATKELNGKVVNLESENTELKAMLVAMSNRMDDAGI